MKRAERETRLGHTQEIDPTNNDSELNSKSALYIAEKQKVSKVKNELQERASSGGLERNRPG